MKIIYTESALIELEEFQEQRKSELERYLKNRKYVFGDETIEITASDIREASKQFKIAELTKSKLPMTSMVLKLYMVFGIGLTIVGLFYPQIKQMIDENPNQLLLIASGLILSLLSFFGSYYFKARQDRNLELERKYIEFESRIKSDAEDTANKSSKRDA